MRTDIFSYLQNNIYGKINNNKNKIKTHSTIFGIWSIRKQNFVKYFFLEVCWKH